MGEHWDRAGIELTYQFTQNREDGRSKATECRTDGTDVLIVVGGDGTVSTVGAALLGSRVTMGVVPAGSGNGFARHFGIPLSPPRAVQALAEAEVRQIDVGVVHERPFLVTCSMAWDAAIVRTFERSPVRGIIPYVFAGVYEFIEYQPQPIEVLLDSGERLQFDDPIVFTVANLTQYGGGAVIAPQAEPDDGLLELIVVRQRDIPMLLPNLPKVIRGVFAEVPQITCRRFREMTVRRLHPAPIQVDGELMEAPAELRVSLHTRSLNILAPRSSR